MSAPARLRVADRCDRCRAQAYVRVEVAGLPLDFCAHHYRLHEPALVEAGAAVTHDDRHTLTPRSTQGDVY